MNKKDKIATFVTITIIVTMVCGYLLWSSLKKKDYQDYYEPVSDEIIEINNLDDEALDVGSTDIDMNEIPLVVVTNKEGLNADKDDMLSDYGVASLQEYLSRYIGYYLPLENGVIYEAEYVNGSYAVYSGIPQFDVTLYYDDEEIDISCFFINSLNRYNFDSDISR